MKISLRLIGLIGVLLFGSLYGLTYGVPEQLEKAAKTFVKHQVEKEVMEKVNAAKNTTFAQRAQSLADKMGFQESQLKKDLEQNLPEKIAKILAQLCGFDCEKEKLFAQGIRAGYQERIKTIQLGKFNLSRIVTGKYLEIVGQLKNDFRIFALSNAMMFALLLLLSVFKPQAIRQLFIPATLLFTATLVASSIYLFGQNWFFTILYNDYMGFGYLAYLGIIFAFLLDIALNQCRITSQVFNFIGNALGSVASVTPC